MTNSEQDVANTKRNILDAFDKFEKAKKSGNVKERKIAKNALGNVVVELIHLIGNEDLALLDTTTTQNENKEILTNLQGITVNRKKK